MERLLERAIEDAAKLPDSVQKEVGAWLLAEIEDENRWNELFSQPGDAIERLADQALREDGTGRART